MARDPGRPYVYISLFTGYRACQPPQFSGPSTMHEKRTAAGSTTAALTSSTGSVTTTLRALAGLLRWGLPDQRKRNVVGVHAAWFWDLSSHHPKCALFPWQIISKDLWPNLLQYYVGSQEPGARGGSDRCVSPGSALKHVLNGDLLILSFLQLLAGMCL